MPAISVSRPAAVAILVVQRIRITSPSTPPRAALSPGVVPARPEVRLTGMLATKHQKAGGGAPCAPSIARREVAILSASLVTAAFQVLALGGVVGQADRALTRRGGLVRQTE